ncbi:MAG: foldase protein PrsA [Candidatus Krumholzibacteriota bacterium]
MKRKILAVLVLMAGIYLSCSPADKDEIVVATVEGKEITAADFERVAEIIDSEYLPDTNSVEGKKKILDYMIAKEVMALRAKELGYDKDEQYVGFWSSYRNPFLVQALTKYYIADKVKVTDRMVQDYYDDMSEEFVLSQITVLDSMEAVRIREQIINGADFAEMARRYSIAPTADKGGEIGTMSIGAMYWWIEEALLGTEKGEVTPVVHVQNGYSILKVHDRRTIKPTQDMEYTRKRVRHIEEEKRLKEVKEEIARKMNFKIYSDGLEVAFNSLPLKDIPNEDIVKGRVTMQNAPKLNLRDEFKGMLLASYEGRDITLEDFEYIYNNLQLPDRPRRQQGKYMIVDLLHKKFFNDVLPGYAENELKILEYPPVKEAYEKKKEELLVNLLYRESVMNNVTVTSGEVEEYIRENKDKLRTREQRDYSLILNSDKEIVEKAARLAREGANFAKLAREYSEHIEDKNSKVNVGLGADGRYPALDVVAFDLPEEGAISEPFKTARGWVVIKLDEIEEGKPLTEENARRFGQGQLKKKKENELFEKKVAEWRKRYEVTINEENLEKAELSRLNKG